MKSEDVKKVLSYYMLLKGTLGLIGFVMFLTTNFSILSYLSYFQYLFGDLGLFRVTMLLPLMLAIFGLVAYYAIKKDLGFARLLTVIVLIPDLFFFPVGTIVSVILIGICITKIPEFKPLGTNERPYRVAGAVILVVSLLFILVSYGFISNLTSNLNVQASVSVLDASLENQTGRVDVIIELNTPPASTQAVEIQDAFVQEVDQVGGQVTGTLIMNANIVRATVDASQLAALAQNPMVKSIIPNEIIVYAPNDDYQQQTIQLLENTLTLTQCSTLLHTNQLWSQGITGKGIIVAVVDTGINAELPIFQRGGKSIVVDSLQLYGEHVYWHGTAVASCIASQAPDVELLNVEVFQQTSSGVGAATYDIMKGWDWVAQWKAQHHQFVICCNSLGAPPFATGAHTLDSKADNMVIINNIPMIVAAGNGYPTNPISLRINSPGQAADVLTVGAVDNSLFLATFSCRGKTDYGMAKPDVVAPGVNIQMVDDNGNNKTASGTSFATPLTAGVCALLAQQHPDFSAKQLEDSIKVGADKTVIPHATTDYGAGFVDAPSALAATNGQKPEKNQSYTLLVFPVLGIFVLLYPDIKKIKI